MGYDMSNDQDTSVFLYNLISSLYNIYYKGNLYVLIPPISCSVILESIQIQYKNKGYFAKCHCVRT